MLSVIASDCMEHPQLVVYAVGVGVPVVSAVGVGVPVGLL